MRVKCEAKDCDHVGSLGNSIRHRRVYIARGKRIKILICDHCFEEVETRRREKQ